MQTIVEYTQHKPPQNDFPARIVSPPVSRPCCHEGMELVGPPQRDGRWIFQYRRCRGCGFTLRTILRYIPDAAELADLRKGLQACRLSGYPE